MTKHKSKQGTITDVDEIAAEAEASLEMIRAAAQQIQQLAAIRTRFEDMAQRYDAMNARTTEMTGVIDGIKKLEGDLRKNVEIYLKRSQEQESKLNQQQKEAARNLDRKVDEFERSFVEELRKLDSKTQEHQKEQQKNLEEQLHSVRTLIQKQQQEVQQQFQALNTTLSLVSESAAQTKRLATQLKTLQVLLVVAILLAVLGVVR